MNLWDFLVAAFAFSFLIGVALVFTVVVAFALLLLMRSAVGRNDAIRVSTGGGSVPGIPFYTKQGRFFQETTYLETLATIMLTAKQITYDDAGKAQQSSTWYAVSKTASWPGDAAGAIEQIQDALGEAAKKSTPDAQLDEWSHALDRFEMLAPYNGSVPATAPLVGNDVRAESAVDYSQPYYLNAAQPLIGSANLSAKLAADGTLTESTATVEDTTLATILGALPASELISAFPTPDFSKPAKAVTLNMMEGMIELLAAPQVRHEFSLELERHYVRHVLRRDQATRDFAGPIPLGEHTLAWYRCEYISAVDIGEEEDEKAEAAA